MDHPESHTIAVATHGRYLLRPGAPPAGPVLIGFHGYAESSEAQMQRLTAVRNLEAWTLVSIQGLHRFYRRPSDEVVASWMTRQDRELMIGDNVAYVDAVLDAIVAPGATAWPLVFAGFSQGVAMAFRAAAGRRRPSAIVACGGDVPPELGSSDLRRIPRVLLGRGRDDEWYTRQAFDADVARLRAADVTVEPVVVGGGHHWTAEFGDAIARFLGRLT